MIKKFLLILFVFLLLGATQPKSSWSNWSNSYSEGVSLKCDDSIHAVTFAHRDKYYSAVIVDDVRTKIANIAIFLDHKDNSPMLQIVDPKTNEVHHINLLLLAKITEGQEEDRLPWQGVQPTNPIGVSE